MQAVGIATFASLLSEYLRLAERGETVLVTDRDRVIAELVPPRPEHGLGPGAILLAEAVRQGFVRPPLSGPTRAPAPKRAAPWIELALELDQDREDR